MKLKRTILLFGGGGGTQAAPALHTVDIPTAAAAATQADQHGYQLSDQDFARRFPQLVTGRNFSINEADRQLGGGLGSQAKSALSEAGLGDEATSMQGSNEFKTSRNEGMPVLAKEARDRNYFETLLASNPERQIGLSGKGVSAILSANTGNLNAYNQAIYGTQLNSYNSAMQQQASNFGALTSLVGGLAGNAAKFYTPSVNSDPYTQAFAGGAYYNFGNVPQANLSDGPTSQPLSYDAIGGP